MCSDVREQEADLFDGEVATFRDILVRETREDDSRVARVQISPSGNGQRLSQRHQLFVDGVVFRAFGLALVDVALNVVELELAASADGSRLVAVAYDGYLNTSFDSGATWQLRDPVRRTWASVAASADGRRLFATVNQGQIYASSDGGETWAPTSAPTGTWTTVASSADGSKLVALTLDKGIYTSVDSGVTWVPRGNVRFWWSVASSADGTKLVAVDRGSLGGIGRIYTSSDSGVTWVPREQDRNWVSVASSADGNRLFAAARGGHLYTSQDTGVSWVAREENRDWASVATSADGVRASAVEQGGDVYTSAAGTTLGTAGALSGDEGETVELQYGGNGVFNVRSFTGSLTFD